MNDDRELEREAMQMADGYLPEGTFVTTSWANQKVDDPKAVGYAAMPVDSTRGDATRAPSIPHAVEVLGRLARALLDNASAELQPHIVDSYTESLTALLEAYERLALAHHRILALAGGGSDLVGTLLNVAEASRQALLLPFLDPAIVAHLEDLRSAPSKPARRTMRYVGTP